jgi:hypothetical protein
MTNIQTLPSKSQPTESGRAEMGNFFQPTDSQKSLEKNGFGFENYLKKNNDLSNTSENCVHQTEIHTLISPKTEETHSLPIPPSQSITSIDSEDHSDQLDFFLTDFESTIQDSVKTTTEPLAMMTSNLPPLANPPQKPFQEPSPSLESSDILSKDTCDINQESREFIDFESKEIQSKKNETLLYAYSSLGVSLNTEPVLQPILSPATPELTNSQSLSTPAPATEIRHSSPSTHAPSALNALPSELDKFHQTGRNQIQLDIPVAAQGSVASAESAKNSTSENTQEPDQKSSTAQNSLNPLEIKREQSNFSGKENPPDQKPSLHHTSKTDGMEPAPQDSKMVSLATFDTTESGSASPREPLLASIPRVSSVNNLTTDSLAPIDKVLDTAQAQSTAPAPAAEIRHLSPSSHAASIFKSLPAELEKFQQTGSNQLQLDIPMGDQESVRIRLSLRAGELHSTFITESPELREALQKAWPEFAQHSRDRGYRLGDPSFQQSFQGNDTTSGQNNRRNRDSHDDTPAALSASFPSRKSGQPRPSSTKQSSTALWA